MMDSFGQLALSIYREYGIGMLVMLTVLGVALAYLLKYGGKSLYRLVVNRTQRRKVSLEHHVLFHKLDTLLKYKITNMNINCPLRNKIFSDLLTIRLLAVRNVLADYAKSDVDELSAADFRQATADRIQAIAFMWSSNALKDGIPAIAIEKFRQQNDIWAHVLDSVILDQCLVTTIYQTNGERLDTIFDMIGSFEIHCFSDVEKVVSHLNGEISACTYKGLTCNNCSPDCHFKAKKFKDNEKEIPK